MNDLQQLIHSLQVSEKKSLQYFIKCLGSSSNSGEKLIELFHTLSKLNTAPSSDYLIKKLKLKDKSVLNVLAFRLKQKIFDFIILDNNLERYKQLDILNYTSIKLRKKLTQLNYLIRNKGTLKLLESELNSLINESIKQEIYSVAIDALQLKKQLFTRKKGIKEYLKVSHQLDILKEKEKNINNAIDFQTYFIARYEIKNTTTKNEINKELEEKLIELNESYLKHPSPLMKYLINFLENYYFTINENYLAAREVSLENLTLIQKSPSLLNKQKLGATYINLYTIDINLKEYKRAYNNIKAALQYFPKFSLNYYKTIESKMMVNCYLEKTGSALNDLKLLGTLTNSSYPVEFEKLKYYKAFILFHSKEYTKANRIINTGINMPIDKDGKDIYLRLIQICVLVSLNKLLLAVQHTDNLIRHYKRFHSKKNKNERLSKLVLLFKYLSNQDFTDIKLNEPLKKVIQTLSHDKKSMWEPLSPELYPIDKWVIEHYQLTLNSEKAMRIKSSIQALKTNS